MAGHLLSGSGLYLRAVQTPVSLNWDPDRQRSYQPLSSLDVHSWKRAGDFPTMGQAFSTEDEKTSALLVTARRWPT